MDQNHIRIAPEAAADEPASPFHPSVAHPAEPDPATDPFEPDGHDDSGPTFASPEAERLYWRAYMDGARAAGREPGHPHMPPDFSLDLSRDGRQPGLTSSKLIEPWPEAVPVPGGGSVATGYGGSAPPADALPAGRAPRSDGWDDARMTRFLATLAETGVVADACRACGMSRDAAYSLRRRASGRAFALAWDSALLIARGAIADDVMTRARHGVIDRVYRNGELIGERHRYDNRLTMAVLTRLDRQAEGLGENAPVVRAIAHEFDQFLGLLPRGNEAAEQFLSARFPESSSPLMGEGGVGVDSRARGASPKTHRPSPTATPTQPPPSRGRSEGEPTLLARLANYERHGAGLPCEMETGDLDPTEMERWTDDQLERAMLTGLLARLQDSDWPQSAFDGSADGTDGMCKLRKFYLLVHPPLSPSGPAVPVEEGDDFAGCSVWEEEEGWMTDFPPPDGFDGHEQDEPGAEDYRRSLTQEELEILGLDEASEAAERQEVLAEQRAAYDRYFGEEPDADGAAADSGAAS
ncbi:hypothetical protein [Allosphingosinicella sp.]|jgi:hypothetical protein|uniref:hypothetical protein n=1 Tax=Allosphingosinicella sp. TaxID=2823234 RepID=UPI002F114AF5